MSKDHLELSSRMDEPWSYKYAPMDAGVFDKNLHFTALIGLSLLILAFSRMCWLKPMALTRKLRQQGVNVHPYRFLFGNAREIKQLNTITYKQKDIGCPTNHNILPYVLPFHSKVSQAYGKTYFYWWGTLPRLVIANADDINNVMATKFKEYKKAQSTFLLLHRIFGSGLLIAEGEDWENHRRILAPAFYNDKLKVMVADMAKSAELMTISWKNTVEENGGSAEIEVGRHLKNVTADIIARTCFGSSYEKGRAVFERQVLLLELALSQMLLNTMLPGYRFIPTPTNLKCWKIERSVDKDLREIMETRRHAVKQGGASSYGDDLLGLSLAANEASDHVYNNQEPAKAGTRKPNWKLTTREVMDECKSFFFAGHETTANLLTWTMMLLAVYSEWQERARQEVFEICGKASEPKAEQLNKLRILGMILNESLRLYSPVPQLGARMPAGGEVKLGNLSIPPRTGIVIPVLAVHRDKDHWGDDADEFKPERFAEGVSKACKNPHAFMPFALGPRTCIGQTFAMMEAKVVIATIVQRFEFRLSPNYCHSPTNLITMKPKHGMQIIMESIP